jgi:two-component sensor histidine kinase
MRGERIRPVETVRYRKDGTPVHVRIAGAPIIIGGTVSGVVGVYTDISDRVRAEEGLKSSVEEKEVLMKELNHRVKNNLAMISALIGLKDSALGGGSDVSDLVNQIDAIRLIHEKLDESEHIGTIDVREYLGDLLQTIFSSYSEGPVRLDINIENRQVTTKKAVSLGLIVNELATNAVKHRFTEDAEHRFSIGFTEDTAKGEYIAAVSNSGRPFPEDIDLDNPDTLGLRLISALTEQLNGTIELNRAPEPEFTIRFPARQ